MDIIKFIVEQQKNNEYEIGNLDTFFTCNSIDEINFRDLKVGQILNIKNSLFLYQGFNHETMQVRLMKLERSETICSSQIIY